MSIRTYLKLSAFIFAVLALAGLSIGQATAQTVTAVSPNTGPTFGHSLVTITGTGFTGATAVDFGGVAAISFNVISPTSIQAYSPPQAAGVVDITVTSGGVSPTNPADQFSYSGPYVNLVAPTAGSTVGGTSVSITGTGFTGVTQVYFGTLPATSFVFNSDTSVTAVSPAQAQGAVNVIVVASGNTSPSNAGDVFTYGPSVTSITTNTSGPTAGGTSVTVKGIGFTGATSVDFGGVAGTNLTVVNDNQITITSPPNAPGTVDITVATPGGLSITSASDHYTYVGPYVTGVSPVNGPTSGANTVTVSGSGFAGATGVYFGTVLVTIAPNVSDSTISVTAPSQPYGSVDVRVVNTTESPINAPADTYTYQGPYVTGVSPVGGPVAGGGTPVTITGTGFTGLIAVYFGGVPSTSITFNSDTSVSAVAPAQAQGVVDVLVEAGGNVSPVVPADQYTYGANITDLSVHTGPTSGNISVTITGSGFTNASAVYFGAVSASFTVNSDGSISATSPVQPQGLVDVTVVAPGGTSPIVPADEFTYVGPYITGVSPAFGSDDGGTVVVITGSGFTAATKVNFGSTPATTYTVNSDTSITATAPAGTIGTVDITVVSTVSAVNYTSPVLVADEFTYGPQITAALSTTTGPTTGGTSVTITGIGFKGATSVNFGSVNVSLGGPNVSDTSITVNSPAQAAGTVDVTVVSPNGTSPITQPNDQFAYTGPYVTLVNPPTGQTSGGTSVTITGTGFLNATAVDFGAVSVALGAPSASDTSITVNSPAQASGVVDITVIGATSTSPVVPADQFTYTGPYVTGLGTTTGTTAGGTSVTITGTGFTGVTQVYFGTVPATSFTFNSDISITATSPQQAAGYVDVTVHAGSTSPINQPADQFDYTGPYVTAVSPSSGSDAGGDSVVVTGSGFLGATAVDFGATAGSGINVVNDTTIDITSPAHSQGSVDVTVIGATSTSPVNAPADQFTYGPSVTSVSPTSGFTSGGTLLTEVTIKGTFLTNTTAVYFGTVQAPAFTVVNPGEVTAEYPAQAAGTVDVTVDTSDGNTPINSPADNFKYTGPYVTNLIPNTGPTLGGTSVTINGSGFSGATAVEFGGVPGTSFDEVSDAQITVTSPANPTGSVSLIVIGATSNSNAATYTYTGPYVTGVSPNVGVVAGGETISITGTGFTGTTAVDFGTAPSTLVTVISDTQLSAVAPAEAAGIYDITVTNGTVSPVVPADKFTVDNVPVVTSVVPNIGAVGGTPNITVNGSGFTSATAVDFGGTPGTIVGTPTETAITVTVPTLGAGTVDVTVVTPVGTSATSLADQYTEEAAPTVTAVSPSTGTIAGGETVTITGTGFTGATSVQFTTPAPSSVAATNVVVVSSTEITATAPALAGNASPYDVTVTTPEGTSAVSEPDDDYTVLPAPTFTTVDLNNPAGVVATVEQGGVPTSTGPNVWDGNIDIKGSFVSGANSVVTIGGITATVAGTSTNTDLIVAVPPTILAAPGAYAVTASNAGGTPVTATGLPVTVIAGPQITTTSVASFPLNHASVDLLINGSGFSGGGANNNVTVTFSQVGSSPATVVTDTLAPSSDSAIDIPAAFISSNLGLGSWTISVAVNVNDTVATTTYPVPLTIYPALSLSSVSPSTIPETSGTVSIALNGAGFDVAGLPGATQTVTLNGQTGPTGPFTGTITAVTGTTLTVTLPSSVTTAPNTYNVTVSTQATNVAPQSVTLTGGLTVTADPTITSVSTRNPLATPAAVEQGGVPTAFGGWDGKVNINGAFPAGLTPTVTINGLASTVNIGNSTTALIEATVPPGVTAAAGRYNVAVTLSSNPAAASATATTFFPAFDVVAAPTITSLSTLSTSVDESDTALTITGSGFTAAPQSVTPTVTFTPVGGGTAVTATLTSDTNTTIVVAGSFLATLAQGSYTVKVTDVLNGTTATATYATPYVIVGAPTLTSVLPSIIPAQATGSTVTVTLAGTNFLPGATVTFTPTSPVGPAVSGTATAITPTSISVAISTGIADTINTYNVQVSNPGNGTPSGTVAFTVAPDPTLSALTTSSPNAIEAGGAGTWNGLIAATGTFTTTLTTTATIGTTSATAGTPTATTDSITVPTSIVDSPGAYPVTITQTSLTGGISATTGAQTFTVVANPVITSLSIPGTTFGESVPTLTISGSGFTAAPATANSTVVTLTPVGGGTAVTATLTSTTNTSIVVAGSTLAGLAAGSYTVSVTVTLNSTTATATYATPFVVAGAPTLTSVSPSLIPRQTTGSTVTVTLAGTNFLPGATVTFTPTSPIGPAVSGTVNLITPTSISVAISTGIADTLNTYNVQVANPGNGTPSGTVAFTVVPDPTLSALTTSSPNAIEAGGAGTWNGLIAATGTFTTTLTTTAIIGTTAATATTPTATTDSITVPTSIVDSVGAYPVTITQTSLTGGISATTSAQTFTVVANPVIGSLSIAGTTVGETVPTLTISGSGFTAAPATANSTVVTFTPVGGGTAVTATLTSTSNTSIVVAGSTLGGLAAGSYTVAVTVTLNNTTATATYANPFVVAGAPTLTSVSPSLIPQQTTGSTVTLALAGTNFLPGATVTFTPTSPTGPAVSGTATVITPTSISVGISTGIADTLNTYNVVVTNPGNGTPSGSVTLTVIADPTLSAFTTSSPSAIEAGGIGTWNGLIAATGTFSTVLTTTATIGTTTATAGTPTATTDSITVPTSIVDSVGVYPVTITQTSLTGGIFGTTASQPFTVVANPVIGSLSIPGTTLGETVPTLTITGSGFTAAPATANTTVVTFTPVGGGTAVTANLGTVSNISIVVLGSTLSTLAAGSYTVAVTVTLNGTTATATYANPFVVAGAPTLTSVSPSLIPKQTTGSTVTLTLAGTNFLPGATVTFTPTSPVGSAVSGTASVITPTSISVGISTGIADTLNTYNVVVTNPGNGTPSGAVTLTVVADPTLSAFTTSSPLAIEAGGVGTWNGLIAATGTFSTSLTTTATIGTTAATAGTPTATTDSITVPSSIIDSTGAYPVTITQTSLTGGISATTSAQTFTVVANPVITSLSIPGIELNASGTNLKLNGTGFTAAPATGAVTTVTFTPVGPGTTTSYTGTPNSGALFTVPGSFLATLGANTYEVSITVVLNGTTATGTYGATFIVSASPIVTGITPTTAIVPAATTTPAITAIPVTVSGVGFLAGGDTSLASAVLDFSLSTGGPTTTGLTLSSSDTAVTANIPTPSILNNTGLYNVAVTTTPSGSSTGTTSTTFAQVFIHPGFTGTTLAVAPAVVPTQSGDTQVKVIASAPVVFNGIVPSVNILDQNGNLVTTISGTSVSEGTSASILLVTLPSSLLTIPINYQLELTYTAGSGQTAISNTVDFAVGPNRINITASPEAFAGDISTTVTLTGETLAGVAVPLNFADYNALTITRLSDGHVFTFNPALVLQPQSNGTIVVDLSNNPSQPWNDVLSTAGALQFNLYNASNSALVYPLYGNLVIQYLDPVAPNDGSPNAAFNPSSSVSSQLNLFSIPGSYSTEDESGTSIQYDSVFNGTESNTAVALTSSQSIFGYETNDNSGILTGLTGLNTPTEVSPVAYWIAGYGSGEGIYNSTTYNLTSTVAVNDAGGPSFPIPGVGYWSRLWTQTGPAIHSVTPTYDIHVINKGKSPADINGYTEVHLKLGWNLIGDPYYYPVPLSTLLFSAESDKTDGWTLSDVSSYAATAGENWISPTLYRYHYGDATATNNQYIPVTTTDPQPFNTALEPFAGYWIYSGVSDLYLEVPDPGN